jgi:hypothetical protein
VTEEMLASISDSAFDEGAQRAENMYVERADEAPRVLRGKYAQ